MAKFHLKVKLYMKEDVCKDFPQINVCEDKYMNIEDLIQIKT